MLKTIATASLLVGLFGALGPAEAKGGNIFQSPCMSHRNAPGCDAARGNDTVKNAPNAGTSGQAAIGNAGAGGGVNPGAQ